MEFTSLKDYLVAQGAVKVDKVIGPNGAFLSASDAKGVQVCTIPVGKKSQGASLSEYRLLHTQDSTTGEPMVVATASQYETAETMSLV